MGSRKKPGRSTRAPPFNTRAPFAFASSTRASSRARLSSVATGCRTSSFGAWSSPEPNAYAAALAAAFARYPECGVGLFEKLAAWATTQMFKFAQQTLATILGAFADAQFEPIAGFVFAAEERLAELRQRRGVGRDAGFTAEQEEEIARWARFRSGESNLLPSGLLE